MFNGEGKSILISGTSGYFGKYSYDTDDDNNPTFTTKLVFGLNGTYTYKLSDDKKTAELTNTDTKAVSTLKKTDDLDFIPTPGHSPDHAALVLAAGDDYACFSGDLLHSPIQFAHPQWNSAFCGDPRQAEVSRREMMAWGASHHAQWFTGHFAGPSCGWLEKDKQGDYRWREAGQQAADKGKQPT